MKAQKEQLITISFKKGNSTVSTIMSEAELTGTRENLADLIYRCIEDTKNKLMREKDIIDSKLYQLQNW